MLKLSYFQRFAAFGRSVQWSAWGNLAEFISWLSRVYEPIFLHLQYLYLV